MHDEGVVKYQCEWKQTEANSAWNIGSLKSCRDRLFGLGFIGVDAEGIGYGNVSCRYKGESFLITGSATGHIPELTGDHFCLVTSFNLQKNGLTCVGPIQASSESMSHGTIYRCDSAVNTVIHIHYEPMWTFYNGIVPTTDSAVAYGTPGMAYEIERLYRNSDVSKTGFMVMGGHYAGLIAFGAAIEEAEMVIMARYEQFRSAG